ncbi:hypothetical protein [Actinomadura kijaniata]|uniref:hypothetical protein n=1 Tax=Actinomadura kijaniata TaxID=46161 RepID=UPI0008322303|nr:hypothetical protein [Actinomadura kijaniata]
MDRATQVHADMSALDEAGTALEALRDALDLAGIKLPSLGLDICSFTSSVVLVELGRCNPTTVRRLAEVVRRGASDPRRAARLAALAGLLRGQKYTVELLDGDRIHVTDGPDSRGLVVECRERDDDAGRHWFAYRDGTWISEADNPTDALVTLKAELRQGQP